MAPLSWQDAEELRACHICVHGRCDDGHRTRGTRHRATQCASPAVTGGRAPVATGHARAKHGPCGPEALHQDFPGLRDAPPPRPVYAYARAY
jgi:hypothetical protein